MTDTAVIVRETSALASVQRVHSPCAIEGRDIIVTASVQGFKVVVKKTEFFTPGVNLVPSDPQYATGVLCVFFQPDSLLDSDNDEFKFLDSSRGRLIATKKMFGVYSQGLCVPLSVLAKYGLDPSRVVETQDVTLETKTSKYVAPEELPQYKGISGIPPGNPFPTNQVPKTDEPSLQTSLKYLKMIKGRRVTITIKMDGSSMTVTSDGKLCGRNYQWTDRTPSTEAYYKVNDRFQIVEKIRGSGYSFQGELVGPKINKNTAGIGDLEWMVFNVCKDYVYLPHSEVKRLCEEYKFQTVPCLYEDVSADELPFHTIDDWLEFADNQVYANQARAEGIVVKTSDGLSPRISFKVLSRVYCAKK